MNTHLNAFFLFVALMLFISVFYGPWQTLCVDVARHKLFKARNAIFDLALNKKLSFESKEYRQIRKKIETLIRYSHRINWTRFVYVIIRGKLLGQPIQKLSPNMADLIAQISDDDVRSEVEKHINNATRAAIYLIIQRSLILMPVLVAATVVLILGIILRSIFERPENPNFQDAKKVFRSEIEGRFGGVIIPKIQAEAEALEQRECLPHAA